MDWVPTISKLAGYRPEANLKWDGQDVWPLVAGQAKPAPRELYWKGPGGRSFALRSGDWKLVVQDAPDQGKRRVELFHLGEDPYEQHDRAAAEQATVARLEQLLTGQRQRDNDAVPPRPERSAP